MKKMRINIEINNVEKRKDLNKLFIYNNLLLALQHFFISVNMKKQLIFLPAEAGTPDMTLNDLIPRC